MKKTDDKVIEYTKRPDFNGKWLPYGVAMGVVIGFFMDDIPVWAVGGVVGSIVFGSIMAKFENKKSDTEGKEVTHPTNDNDIPPKKPRTHAHWIAIGVAVGVSIGVATDNLGLWIGVGVAIGILGMRIGIMIDS
jgi:hypothetical protein